MGVSTLVRAHLFFKVEVELQEDEDPEKAGEAIGRQLRKQYVVRAVELSSIVIPGTVIPRSVKKQE